jgi:uncharacterized protein YpuA (DUF1002 family)
LLESSSLWFGLKSLTVIAALLYVASAIFLRSKASAGAEREPVQVPSLASR